MKRRSFLTLLAWMGGLGLLRPGRAVDELRKTAEEPLGMRLADLLTDQRSAAAVGRAYLRSAPHERNPHLLVQAIAASRPELRRNLAASDVPRLRAWLSQALREDFEQGRLVEVDGWILAETEARLCALAALRA